MAKKILVVDDDPDLREATAVILTGAGYEVWQASCAKEAQLKLATHLPDLVLLDVMMETDTEGFHLAYQIRINPRLKNVPIIMLTSMEEKTGELMDLENDKEFLPVQAFLRKPLDAKVLKEKVAELVK